MTIVPKDEHTAHTSGISLAIPGGSMFASLVSVHKASSKINRSRLLHLFTARRMNE